MGSCKNISAPFYIFSNPLLNAAKAYSRYIHNCKNSDKNGFWRRPLHFFVRNQLSQTEIIVLNDLKRFF